MLDWLKRTENQTAKILEQLQAANEPVMMFGAGNCGEHYLKILQENGIEVACFLDDDAEKQAHGFLGLPVLPVSHLSIRGGRLLFRPTGPTDSSGGCLPSTRRARNAS